MSSTRIRELLAEGRVAEAARLLGRRYALAGRVVRGRRRSAARSASRPPTCGSHDEKLRARATASTRCGRGIDGETARRVAGAMSIGVRPTFGGQVRTLEVHLLDWSGDLRGPRRSRSSSSTGCGPSCASSGPEALVAAMDATSSARADALAAAAEPSAPGRALRALAADRAALGRRSHSGLPSVRPRC